MGFFALVICWKSWRLAVDSIDTEITSSTYLLPPLYSPQSILAIGFTLLALSAFALAAFQLMEFGVMLTKGESAVPVQERLGEPTGPA